MHKEGSRIWRQHQSLSHMAHSEALTDPSEKEAETKIGVCVRGSMWMGYDEDFFTAGLPQQMFVCMHVCVCVCIWEAGRLCSFLILSSQCAFKAGLLYIYCALTCWRFKDLMFVDSWESHCVATQLFALSRFDVWEAHAEGPEIPISLS